MEIEHDTGYDEIPIILIKRVIDCIAEPLANLINLSLSTGVCPDKIKIAKVIPIFKSGNISDLNKKND